MAETYFCRRRQRKETRQIRRTRLEVTRSGGPSGRSGNLVLNQGDEIVKFLGEILLYSKGSRKGNDIFLRRDPTKKIGWLSEEGSFGGRWRFVD